MEAEVALKKIGSDFEWLDDQENLKTITATLPAIKLDSGEGRTNEKIFFNSLVAAYTGEWNPFFTMHYMLFQLRLIFIAYCSDFRYISPWERME